jgi:hypothetical protein
MKLFNFALLDFLKVCLLFCLILPSQAEDVVRFQSNSSSLLEGTILELIVEKGVEASSSRNGDTFVSRVSKTVYDESGKSLLIPKGSWVTGRVVNVQSPGRLSKAGKLSLDLESLTTLTGESIPLNATLFFERGRINEEGILDPQTSFRTKALEPTKKLLGSNGGQIAAIATLGIPVAATLIGGSAFAAVSKGDNIGLLPTQSFKIQLKDNSAIIKE